MKYLKNHIKVNEEKNHRIKKMGIAYSIDVQNNGYHIGYGSWTTNGGLRKKEKKYKRDVQ